MRRLSGLQLVILATVIAGLAGYAVTFIVFRGTGTAAYALFGVFWGAMYLVVGGLSGLQQEIARATHPIDRGTRSTASRARNFGVLLGAAVFAIVVGTAALWVDTVFPAEGWALVWPLAVGTASYVYVATLAGTLYGVGEWRSIALLMVADAVFRLVLVIAALLVAADVTVLAWAVALPFPLAVITLWPVIRARLVGRSDIDVGYRALTWNVSRTVLASVSTAVLVSGLPLVLGVAAGGRSPALLGELIFTITLVRAPLIVTVMSMQSYLVVHFRDGAAWRAFFFRLAAAILLLGVVLGAAAWWIGPSVMLVVAGPDFALEGPLLGLLVLSSALVAMLCLSGAAVLARSAHRIFTSGWVIAAIVTIAALAVPLPLVERVEVALLVGPVAGLVVHLWWIALARPQPKDSNLHE